MLAHLSHERRNEAETAAPGRLIVLFYDQAIDNLHTAISAIATKRASRIRPGTPARSVSQ